MLLKLCFLIALISSAQSVEFLFKFLSIGQNRFQYEATGNEKLLESYDMIIVGGGSAGCVLANRLSENPKWKILLLEAGGSENFLMDIPMMVHFLQDYDINWKYKTEPSKTSCLAMKGNRCNWPRGKVMGGSSVLNYMVYTRGHPRDFDNWASLGNDGWDFKNVSHYYRRLERHLVPNVTPNYYGKNGPVTISDTTYKSPVAKAFVEAGRELGYPYIDYNGLKQVGFSYIQATVKNGVRESTNTAYIYPIKGRKNLTIRKNSHVTKLLIDDDKNAYGVEFYSNGKYFKVNATKEVILTAGALNTPQILMLSGIGPENHLRNFGIKPIMNLAVGYNLMDHTAPGALTFSINTTSLNSQNILDYNVLDGYFKDFRGPLSSAGGIESMGFIETKKSFDPNGYPDVEIYQIGASLNSDLILKRNYNIKDEIYHEMFEKLRINNVNTFMALPMVLRPKSRGRIKLRSTNPFDAPAIFPNYFSDPHDIETSVRGIRKLIELSKTNAFKKINAKFLTMPVPGCKHLTFDSDEYWECYTRHFTFTIYHYSGTAKMGSRHDKMAVVDPQLRVYGIKGLRVADASIMPQIVTGHTNGPVIMIAEKASDLIKADWQ